MAIDPLNAGRQSTESNLSTQPVQNNVAKSNETTSQTSAQAPATKPEITLSDDSKAINALNKSLADEPHFDESKVAQIKTAISEGNYKIDPDKLAQNMIKHHNELILSDNDEQ